MAQEWSGQTGGTHWMQRALISIIRHTDIRVAYAAMHLWLIWYILVRRTERNGVYTFHRRRGRSRMQAAVDVYRSFYHFGKAIIDRFAVYAGQRYDVQVDNRELYYGRVQSDEGFVMLFSHVGNTEMAGYFLSTPDKRLHILAYAGESPVVMEHRRQELARNNIDMIAVQPGDMSHIYRVSEVLQQGDVLAMAADRRTGDAVTMCTFMGSRAPLPEGPFRVCKAVRKPVLLVFVLKQDAHTYRVTCQELQPDKDLAQTYAQAVEQVALQHPYEWFNFYDFWA